MKRYSYPKAPFSKRRNKEINEFKIIGERCSGTYYIQRLIEHNLKIPHTNEYGHKHFWSKRQEKYPKELLLVCVVRNHTLGCKVFLKRNGILRNICKS